MVTGTTAEGEATTTVEVVGVEAVKEVAYDVQVEEEGAVDMVLKGSRGTLVGFETVGTTVDRGEDPLTLALPTVSGASENA